MAEPTYEVTVKNDDTPVVAAPANDQPTLSEDQIAALIERQSTEKAESIATSKVEALKEELAKSLSGKSQSRYGEHGPESWEKFQDDTTERAVKIAEEKIEKRLEAERKANEEKSKQTLKQAEEAQKAEYAKISAEWQEAVQDGVLPDISNEVKAKLKSGVAYEDLTETEQRDPGLRAYNEARLLHLQLKNEGKSNSFYRTAAQFYNKQPAGARAPVIGGAGASIGPSGQEEDYSYEEIVNNRKKHFKF